MRVASLSVLLLILSGCGVGQDKAQKNTVFVAPSGDDANLGTERTRPLRNLQTAVARAWSLRRGGCRGDIRIELADGLYRLERPVELGAPDGGTNGAKVIWCAAHRGKAVVTGATPLEWRNLEDKDILAVLPAAARGRVRTADLPGVGVLPSFLGGSHLQTPSNDIPVALFCGEERLTCARWPDSGFAHTGRTRIIRDERGKTVGASYEFAAARLAKWADEPFAWSFGLWGVEWADCSYPLFRIDRAASTVMLPSVAIPFGLKRGMPFYVFNALFELDRPGEWVVDRVRRRFYLWPKGDVPTETVVTDGLFVLRDLADVVFDGIVFEKTRKTAIRMKNCSNVTVRASVFRHTCSWAVEIDGGRDCRVAGCDMYDLGEGGIRMSGGDVETFTAAGHIADNNHIHHYGRVFSNYRQGISMNGVGMKAVHNLVHHSAHTGIQWSGSDNAISRNVIHDTCEFNDDAGAIYVWHNSWVKRGGTIDHNVIHYTGKKRFPNATEGIYLDDYSSEIRVVSNLVSRATLGVHVGGGQSNRIRDNVMINCDHALSLSTRYNWPESQKGKDSRVMKELLGKIDLCGGKSWRARYPGIGRLVDLAKSDPLRAHHAFWNEVEGNLGVGSGDFQHDQWKAISNTTVWASNVCVKTDPGFVDYRRLDWRARPDSPYRALIDGCESEKAGLYASDERISPPVRFGEGVTRPDEIGTKSLAKPEINVAVCLDGKLPPGIASFAEDADGCKVQPWSKGTWIMAPYACVVEGGGEWESFAYSFVPTCDCSVRLILMGGHGAKTLYDAVVVNGATADGNLFESAFPIAANDKERVESRCVRCRKGERVSVSFRARPDLSAH